MDIDVIQFIQGNDGAHGAKRDYIRVVSVKVRHSHSARGHYACLVYYVLIIVVDKMKLYLGVTRRNESAHVRAKIIEGVKVIDLLYFEEFSVLPVSVTILGVKHNLLLVVTRDIHTKLDLNSVAEILSLVIFEETVNFIGLLKIPTHLLPYRTIDYIMVTNILRKLDRIITLYQRYRSPSKISILRTNEYLVAGIISLNDTMVINLTEQEELTLVLKFVFVLQLDIKSINDSIVRHAISSLTLSETDQ